MRTLGRASASGDFATAIASGSVTKPFLIRVVASARPDQLVEVRWTVVCTRSNSSGIGSGSRSGDYSDYSGIDHDVRLPMRNPDSCTASASASLATSGTVAVRIYALI